MSQEVSKEIFKGERIESVEKETVSFERPFGAL